ncbi:MAG: hypothetical protein WBP47_11945, partial [Candidatus Promineifilaceae bacterium]
EQTLGVCIVAKNPNSQEQTLGVLAVDVAKNITIRLVRLWQFRVDPPDGRIWRNSLSALAQPAADNGRLRFV